VYVYNDCRADFWEPFIKCAERRWWVGWSRGHGVFKNDGLRFHVCVCCSALQCFAACCSVLQRVAVTWCLRIRWIKVPKMCLEKRRVKVPRVAACCNGLQRVAACCSVLQAHVVFKFDGLRCRVCVLQCAALCCSVLQWRGVFRNDWSRCRVYVLQRVAACCSVLQFALVCCNVLQSVAACCSNVLSLKATDPGV